MFQDKILHFLGATKEWADTLIDLPVKSNKGYPGDLKDCVIFYRTCDLQDMESEDDEQYIFTTPDGMIRSRFNRFQTRVILSNFSEGFDSERIDMVIKMAWNYPKLVINKVTSEYEPFCESQTIYVPPLPNCGAPPRKVVYIQD